MFFHIRIWSLLLYEESYSSILFVDIFPPIFDKHMYTWKNHNCDPSQREERIDLICFPIVVHLGVTTTNIWGDYTLCTDLPLIFLLIAASNFSPTHIVELCRIVCKDNNQIFSWLESNNSEHNESFLNQN